MVKASQGLRHRTRKIFRKSVRERGAVPPLSTILIPYKIGDYVHIVVNPSIHQGMPHRRYVGKTGKIIGFRGRAIIVEVMQGSKKKQLTLFPEHVKPAFDVTERINEIIQKLKELSKIRAEQRKLMLQILSKVK
jgi:large subunit ribosomal protein L21e